MVENVSLINCLHDFKGRRAPCAAPAWISHWATLERGRLGGLNSCPFAGGLMCAQLETAFQSCFPKLRTSVALDIVSVIPTVP